ncbi:MFS transporter [Bifidobacterium moukalabense]|uniref:MFS transporter n=1 Tax=Bifidobacterium moukalabense TaxID=1333651 RepID=UPI001485960B|nr:MFS transporter [Bifidobacterium moukalabense]
MADMRTRRALGKLGLCGGLGSFLGSSAIVGLSTTITMWQVGFGLSNTQVGALSAVLNFAIAIGSVATGAMCGRFGMTRVFNRIGAATACGFLLCAFAFDFWMLLVGVLLAGFGTGVDLPVSLSVMSRDAQDRESGSKLVTVTQLGWQLGMLGSALIAFAVSGFEGAFGGRVLFLILALVAFGLLLWRMNSKEFACLHAVSESLGDAEGADAGQARDDRADGGLPGIMQDRFLRHPFAVLLVFYVFWNLVANTWGQFQTFMLVNANASQSLATGLGIVLYVVMFLANLLVSATINTKWRSPLFVIGGAVAIAAMMLMAAGGGSLWVIVVATAIMYVGLPLAGEAMCKVWVQETFPERSRASAQGCILGFSRFLCGLFAFVAPALMVPGVIGVTLWCFVGVTVVFVAAGCLFLRLRSKGESCAVRPLRDGMAAWRRGRMDGLEG